MSPSKVHRVSNQERPPKPKFKPINPIEEAVKIWLSRLPAELQATIQVHVNELLSCTAKRWVVYPPMVLLPPGSFGDEWSGILGSEISSETMNELWKSVLDNISKREGKGNLTHLAVNSGIPLNKDSHPPPGGAPLAAEEKNQTAQTSSPASENILRTPSGLIMLYGDFGPALSPDQNPREEDFQHAFWVSTKQNGIVQVWAPRYTMFSRGNVKEKARILDFHRHSGEFTSRDVEEGEIEAATAVDLYAGIGYFVFSYARMGMGRVVGWELNPWSVEGLRRGALANGWSVRVVVGDGEGGEGGEERIVVFLEDNAKALERLQRVEMDGRLESGRIMHVNCGLLPTSELSWEMAIGMLRGDGWLHLHENVGVEDIESRKVEIGKILEQWLIGAGDGRTVTTEHVERVKTFAPGVWHCVFDVYVAGKED
ncbi:hypothetical protein ONS96_003412 [Cadophora gregata f. sp. sojae]|nr:hypothetical protein ONS96_003412 [Cadophora gregata f. sp. sojae]